MINHFKRKYVRKRLSKESIEELEKDIQEFTHIPKMNLQELQALNWLKDLKLRGEGVLESGFNLKTL